jgi:Tol biopolymer transport system component
MITRIARFGLLTGAGLAALAAAGEPPEAPKIVAPTADEIKAELAKETAEQKALRAELEALAKTGQKIYFGANLGEGARSEVFVMGCDGSNVKQLTTTGGGEPHTPVDGSRVVYTGGNIKLTDPMPEALKGIPFDTQYPPLKWGDQKFNRMKDKTPIVWSMNPDGSDQKPVAFGMMPHYSPDGKFLVYSIWNHPFPCQVAIMNLEKKTEAFLVHPGLRNCGNPVWSPDGNYLIGAQGGAHFVKLNADKTGVENISVIDRGHPCNNDISPCGKFWTYVVDTDGCLGGWLCFRQLDYDKLSASGGGNMPLQHQKGSVNYYPAFSPDSKYYVYAHAEQQAKVNSWELKSKQELYVTRFPDCKATVRVTWNGAGNTHPHWAAK